jgi:hypothetical protein
MRATIRPQRRPRRSRFARRGARWSLVELPASGRLEITQPLRVADQTARVTAVGSEAMEEERQARPTEQALSVDGELEVEIAEICRSPSRSPGRVYETFVVVDDRELDSSRRGASQDRVPRCGDRASGSVPVTRLP